MGKVVTDDLRSRGFDITPQDFHDRFVGGIMPDIRKRLVAAGADLPESWVDHMYRAVMVDDSPVGAWAARDAGMRFFGYVEHGNAAKMKNEGAALVHSMADLKRELGQL